MKKVLFATGNESKVKRFKDDLLNNDIEIISINDIDENIDVIENGHDAIENALIKAREYAKRLDIPVFAMDDSLYIDNIPKDKQPGLYVRRVNGKRLSDEEMIKYYSNLAHEYGVDGRLTCRWVYGIAVINNKIESTYTWSKNDFYIVDKPSDKINLGYPLNTISINKKLNKYFTDMTKEDFSMVEENESDVIEFLCKNLK
jgi:XTP/dITP diphosphohydrolase